MFIGGGCAEFVCVGVGVCDLCDCLYRAGFVCVFKTQGIGILGRLMNSIHHPAATTDSRRSCTPDLNQPYRHTQTRTFPRDIGKTFIYYPQHKSTNILPNSVHTSEFRTRTRNLYMCIQIVYSLHECRNSHTIAH